MSLKELRIAYNNVGSISESTRFLWKKLKSTNGSMVCLKIREKSMCV